MSPAPRPALVQTLQALPGRHRLDRIMTVLPDSRLVGGVVRDLLAGRPVADFDLATPEPPQQVMERLTAAGIKTVPTGLAHGTVTAVIEGVPFEITTLRRDVETDGRHAVVAWTTDWQEDAARRDFTINAMSLDRDGQLFDYFGGAADLQAGRVRFVGEARARIEEDALRILRFFRFQERFGRGAPHDEAVAAIAATAGLLPRLSVERVWSELRRMLAASDPSGIVRLMQRLGVLDQILPEGASPDRLQRLATLCTPADPLLRLAALVEGEAATVAARLKLSNADAQRLASLREGRRPGPEDGEDELRRLLADDDAATLCDRSWLAEITEPEDPVSGNSSRAADWAALRQRLGQIPRPVFPLSGRDGVAAGIPPGPAVGAALRAVSEWWRAGGCRADRAACLARLAIAARA